MALTKDIVTIHGIAVSSAYFRVETVHLPSKTEMMYSINGYVDSSQVHPVWTRQTTAAYDIAGENPFRQAYLHLKTLQDFADATDC